MLAGVLTSLPPMMGKEGVEVGEGAVRQEPGINTLAAARVVLFGARDVWFVVGVPVFSFTPRAGLSRWSALPRHLDDRLRGGAGPGAAGGEAQQRRPAGARRPLVVGGAGPGFVPIGLAVAVASDAPGLEWVVVAGLGLFGLAFAVNSSVHSYLVLAYAGSEKAAEDVGAYAANALGRFIGTLLSGLLYQWGGPSAGCSARR